MECGDLVVVEVGRDVGLCGIAVLQDLDQVLADPAVAQPLGVGGKVLANRCHDQRVCPQLLEVVGNVAGTTAIFPAQFGYQEGDVEDVHLLRQDVVLELVWKHHNGVVGHGAADQCCH